MTCISRLYEVKLYLIAENCFFHNVGYSMFSYVLLHLLRLLGNLKINYLTNCVSLSFQIQLAAI